MFVKFTIAVIAACGMLLTSGNDDEVDLKGVKCIMMGKVDAKAANAVDYMDGKVYLCCKKCVAAFTKDKDKHGDKARHQMVLTGQYEQTACPISGAKVDSEQTAKVGAVEVAFCCGNCKAKVEKAEELTDKVAMVFSADAFKKGFAKKQEKDEKVKQ